jgi:hypothetical protein
MIPLEQQLPSKAAVRLRVGTITAAASGRCSVTVGEVSLTDVPYLVGIAPAVNDRVVLLVDGAAMVVLGKVT